MPGAGPFGAPDRVAHMAGRGDVKESTLQRNTVALILLRGGHAIVTRPPGVPSGTPDIVGVYRGRSIAVETKVGDNVPEPLQVAQMGQWRRGGARVVVAYALEDVEMMLTETDAEIEGAT